jgi:hypothetical protein
VVRFDNEGPDKAEMRGPEGGVNERQLKFFERT